MFFLKHWSVKKIEPLWREFQKVSSENGKPNLIGTMKKVILQPSKKIPCRKFSSSLKREREEKLYRRRQQLHERELRWHGVVPPVVYCLQGGHVVSMLVIDIYLFR